MAEDEVFYKKNVPYRVGVRRNLRDAEGEILSDENPFFAVSKAKLRDFIQANKYGIEKGLIVEVPEPPIEVITPNSITDDQALELVKQFHVLRKRLTEINSESTLLKLLDAAKSSGRSEKVIEMIMNRYEEVSPNAMQGVDR